MTPVNVEAVPLELQHYRQWVTWKSEDRDGRRTKVPYDPSTGRRASVTDRQTWRSFGEAVAAYQSSANGYAGVGFVLTTDDPYCVIDLDHSDDPEAVAVHRLGASP